MENTANEHNPYRGATRYIVFQQPSGWIMERSTKCTPYSNKTKRRYNIPLSERSDLKKGTRENGKVRPMRHGDMYKPRLTGQAGQGRRKQEIV
ncbi:hypothetical protein BGAL_0001g00050 [Botrytis galanthina]|uniref:Uncharacterized protein n=1 Tax=Botrytis galanthina TaxID=278940 RepID=A0A4S8RQ51_9HELO|nr:hypothetical protein BGAL_0001g00050 [Botrytis galanthina]